MEEARAKPVCAEEALNLLNCVARSPYDQDKCVRLLQTLRECVLNKVCFSYYFCDVIFFLLFYFTYGFWMWRIVSIIVSIVVGIGSIVKLIILS